MTWDFSAHPIQRWGLFGGKDEDIELTIETTKTLFHRPHQTLDSTGVSFLPPAMPLINRPLIKNKADAPLQITEAYCYQNEQNSNCRAKVQVADTKERWDGYGLVWTLKYDNDLTTRFTWFTDLTIPLKERPPGSSTARFFKPGEILNAGVDGVSMKDPNGNLLHPAGVEVVVEGATSTNGTVWGDSKSKAYQKMIANRKKFKEGSQ
jgi:hypothetical protein